MQTRVTVRHPDGGVATKTKVTMNIVGGGLLNGGWCKDAFTDGYGVAVIEHTSSGTGEIYVGGKLVGKLRVPGSGEVQLWLDDETTAELRLHHFDRQRTHGNCDDIRFAFVFVEYERALEGALNQRPLVKTMFMANWFTVGNLLKPIMPRENHDHPITSTSGFHADRTVSRHCDHCDSGGIDIACSAAGKRSGAKDTV